MTALGKPVVILMADDDPEDCMMAKEALEEARLANELRFVEDGEELMHYLRREENYGNGVDSPRPGLILLDLNLPRMNGHEALREIKNDPELRRIPVVVLTTSEAEEDIYRTYDLGANSFVVKPVTFEGFVEMVKTLQCYWFQLVELPPKDGERSWQTFQ